jgi:hypothetical protein
MHFGSSRQRLMAVMLPYLWTASCAASATCAKLTSLESSSASRVPLLRVERVALKCIATETFAVLKRQQEEPMSKHDSVTKRNRRPKSAKRVDYTARTMAAVRQLEQAAKLKVKAA